MLTGVIDFEVKKMSGEQFIYTYCVINGRGSVVTVRFPLKTLKIKYLHEETKEGNSHAHRRPVPERLCQEDAVQNA